MSNYKNLIDLHTHSDNSPDGTHAPIYMSDAAVNKNIRAIAFTDHCEVDVYYKENYDRGMRQAFFEAAKAKSAYRGTLVVLNGIELGQPMYDLPLAEKILAAQKYDFVLGSIHNLRDVPDFYYIHDYESIDREALLREYFHEIYLMVEWGGIDSIAHLTYPFRYIYEYNHIDEDIDTYSDQIDAILELAAKKDIALEINTSGLRQPINKLLPEYKTIRRFRELGGQLITIGSDAHYAQHIGVGIKQAYDAALEAGFKTIAMFQRRNPIEIPIE